MIRRMDFAIYNNKTYLVTQQDKELMLWDFEAWLKGFYDAYISLKDCTNKPKVIGNLKDNPNLLPVDCEGYNGEPHAKIVEHIYP